ncbi:SDR family oxidoreductase [Nakamurella aerolata]|uniref:NAD(P)H-binding protein n=1 Tax=Nakamurella aerolata TaxID=1656892 RepID=A0A849A664_9ACTN|nr:NAD(P)H-binding protein [Nakamurella aerolata]NNG36474.1 NAD(P)H-binding protein [Nakamurella aerolata]
MKVAVAGGTGMVGTAVVANLRATGVEPVILSRSAGVDLVSGSGLDELLAGVTAVIDVTSSPDRDAGHLVAFFSSVAQQLQRAAAAAGVERIVTLSIVGIDGNEERPHYAGKLAQERAAKAGQVPWIILRATQFHSYGGQVLQWMRRGRRVSVPTQPTQPVDIATVAAHLVRLAIGDDAIGQTVELAGPQRSTVADQVRVAAELAGDEVEVAEQWLPGGTEERMRAGGALPPPPARSSTGRRSTNGQRHNGSEPARPVRD